jgi:hypothetical protein
MARFEPANLAALKHGATAERQIRPVAANHRRRVLRQLRLSPRDLDPIGKGYLDIYCRTMAKLQLLDVYFLQQGLLKADGEPQAATRFYISLANSARHTLARLEGHLRQRGLEPSMVAVLQGEARRLES